MSGFETIYQLSIKFWILGKLVLVFSLQNGVSEISDLNSNSLPSESAYISHKKFIDTTWRSCVSTYSLI